MVECTELSVELRSDRRESRIVLARKKSSSGLTEEDVVLLVGLLLLLLVAMVVLFVLVVVLLLLLSAGWLSVASRLVELCNGGAISVFWLWFLSLWPAAAPCGSIVRSACCCDVCNRLRMVRARRNASWLSFSSAASGEDKRDLQPPSFLGERRLLEKTVRLMNIQLTHATCALLPGKVLEGIVAPCGRNALVAVLLVHRQHRFV